MERTTGFRTFLSLLYFEVPKVPEFQLYQSSSRDTSIDDLRWSSAMDAAPTFARDFIRKLQKLQSNPATRLTTAATAEPELPSYNVADAADVDLLVSSSTPVQVQLGTGADIYTTTLIPAILAAHSEVILVTCFWAKSETLSALGDALDRLAAHRRALIDRGGHVQPLRMHICFSSRSLLQKLFHTSSRHGYTYPPSSWPKTLGLPAAQVLDAGRIQLQVKTLFFLPFSVMHPKFLIIDRHRAFIPSCNVSWEAWLEGCVEISGPAIVGLLDFFARTWNPWNMDLGKLPRLPTGSPPEAPDPPSPEPILSSAHHCEQLPSPSSPILTVILPSSHHRNPNFRPFPWQAAAPPPPTPLNVALLHLINNSRHTIYVQTPNLTCAPVIEALLDALSRGVDVTIITSYNMMLVEQLLTAGTTTSWCVHSLIRRYSSMIQKAARPAPEVHRGRVVPDDDAQHSVAFESDLEGQTLLPGQLRISYFQPRQASKPDRQHSLLVAPKEPVHSHLKLTVVDGEHTVLGSGNMDRASWYTSQELGILFHSRDFAATMMNAVTLALDGRLNVIFDKR
ncbi:phospholipase D/nuclease [Coniochaeta ligniaria NRRL 30616]|uniref:Phospholipase D/nuclease n=1 Tax=Coniochaeta ligniaria NRRL 30616 TaxID=1408157 RepID=A0A1J7IPD9_9PEZI|nr:phospholipase D/nuclease [Coniochaeta ligniaria NRRL 30616]